MNSIFIPGNVPSSKNGKQWTGRILINSKATRAYIKNSTEFYKFDYINPTQTIHDVMVKFNWLKDDNCEEIIPIFEEYSYNKENPGVIIKILS